MKRLASLILTLALSLGLCVPAWAAEFSDVPTDHLFYSAIMDCSEKGIVGGYSDGTFKPANTVTKSNFAVILSRAFYAGDIAQHNDDYNLYVYGPFAGNYLAAYYNGAFEGASFYEDFVMLRLDVMNTGINRYDMAQLLANVMKNKGFTVNDSEKTAAQARIADYSAMPDQYKDAVATVYALGIIGGYSDGTFGGELTMNRGQAAVVIYRLVQYVGDGSGTEPETSVDDELKNVIEDPAGPGSSETAPETPKPTTVAVTKEAPDTYGLTAWTIADNGYSTGLLNNGKPITEANVLAMLAEAKKIWSDGLSWNGTGRNTNIYNSGKGTTVGYKAVLRHNTHPSQGCGGFAAMLSDYIFGGTSNPVRKLSDNTQVRPGDIVIRINPDGSVSHVSIAVTTAHYDGTMPCIRTANGNSEIISNCENPWLL